MNATKTLKDFTTAELREELEKLECENHPSSLVLIEAIRAELDQRDFKMTS